LDGSEVDVEVTAIAIRIDNKPALQLLIRNITEKKQAEETIRKTEERYRALVDNTFEGILIIDFEGKVLFANQSLIRTFEYESFEEIAGENVFRFIAPESVPQAITDLTNVVQGIEVEVANYAGITSKGNKIWFESLGKIIDYEGIKADIISVRDITAKKLAEEKLLENENRFRAITETANDAIVVSNDKGQIVFSNPSALKVFGYEESEFTGMSFEMIIPERFRTTHSEHFESFTHRHVPGTIGKTREFAAIKKDGNEFPMEISLSHWQTSAGVFVAANIRDITERKLAESELIHARDRAEESDRLKSAFLTNMSHEIRTPMNGILGFAELLKNPGLSGDQQQEYIRIIMRSGDRMLNIINDIVDISKIESGQVKVSLSATNINEQIEDIYILFKTQAEKKGLQMVFNNSLPATECILNTDQEKIYAILSNLVKNAIKYSDRGTIEFGYLPEYVSEKPGEPHSLKFYVKDNGIGIPVNRQKAIFDRFVQADIADKLAYQGAGLGLSISKAYVEMLGGQIWVESEESKGSAFYFIVPFTPAPAAKNTDTNDLTPEPASDQIKKLKVLIVEDDVTSEMLISLMIKSFSKEIISKTTGSEAVEACRNNPDLDLILMDIKMPDMDGYEATRKIREFNKEIIIIAQTAFGLSSDREKAIEAGCNDYISKPLNLAFLRELIQKHFENTN
jgi:hypothetical protein